MTRIDAKVQPNMQNGVCSKFDEVSRSRDFNRFFIDQVYLKTWDGSVNGAPPTGGGGGPGQCIFILCLDSLADPL